jgi:hypothetical protein
MRRCLGPAALVVIGLLIPGCGHATTQRTVVAGYIKQVDAIEAALNRPLQAVTQAGSQFVSERRAGSSTPANLLTLAHERALEQALREIKGLQRRLAAIVPPPPARHLRVLLLRLIAAEAGMTREVAKLVAFLPSFQDALRPLGPATNQLQAALAKTQALGYGTAGVAASLSVKAAALTHYKALLGAVVAQLQHLHPPAVSTPQYTTQVATLQHMSTSAGTLANALGQGQSNVTSLLLDFNHAVAGNQTLAAQRAQIAAVRAYDARARSLDTLAQAIQVERARLANTLR